MPPIARAYVRWIDRFNRIVGRIVMWGIFAMIGVLFWSVISKTFFHPSLWTLELAQFLMVAYYLLGGPYSMQTDDHVRMDLVYGRWSPRRRAVVDSVTILFLIFYLGFLLAGGVSSLAYALEFGEKSYSAWKPQMWPIKTVMCVAILLMLMQAVAQLIRDVAAARGEPLPPAIPPHASADDTPGQAAGDHAR